MSDFGSHRRSLGLSVGECAKMLPIDPRNLRRWESVNDKATPPEWALRRIEVWLNFNGAFNEEYKRFVLGE